MIERAAITTPAFFIALPSIHWLLGEAAVMFEIVSTGAKSRAELADDFGLGSIGLFVVVPATLIGAVTTAWFFLVENEALREGQMLNKLSSSP